VRQWRIAGLDKEITMTLDTSNTNVAYLLGRLFATLEKAQKDAVPGANTTIKDRFFGSASATPRSVFPLLICRAQHHIQKAEYGRFTDKIIEKIMAGISDFPAHLALEDQGLFAIGYYHQRPELYRKADDKNTEHKED
ncbi:MAG TPA: type I-C CRISPR-associated protein Cas8c/Csd1, partial [Planctomycetota bacterium]|nr:type I-C CRISPR-associated protein Cas8c/Csd1 [Planctomycetota bacterium]